MGLVKEIAVLEVEWPGSHAGLTVGGHLERWQEKALGWAGGRVGKRRIRFTVQKGTLSCTQ